jgi:hypothetical protein
MSAEERYPERCTAVYFARAVIFEAEFRKMKSAKPGMRMFSRKYCEWRPRR